MMRIGANTVLVLRGYLPLQPPLLRNSLIPKIQPKIGGRGGSPPARCTLALMRYGFWLPVFGGWLRNIDDEQMPATFDYVRDLCVRAEALGYDLTLIAELNLNDIKGVEADSLDALTTTAALAAVTQKLELMVAVRPTFHLPALLAKQ